jgi:hypothetical protein
MKRFPGDRPLFFTGATSIVLSIILDYNWTGAHCTVYFGETITQVCISTFRFSLLGPLSLPSVTGPLLFTGLFMELFALGMAYGNWRDRRYYPPLAVTIDPTSETKP